MVNQKQSRFERVAGWSFRRRWWALALWVVVFAAVTAAAQLVGMATRSRVEAMLDQVRGLPHVAGVLSPYAGPATVSADGTIGYATVTLDGQSADMPPDDIRRVVDTARAAEGSGLQVEVGGEA